HDPSDFDYNADYSNFSTEDCDGDLPYAKIYIPIFYFVIFFTGLFGNVFVIAAMTLKQTTKRLVDIFVINLAVADLVFVFTLPLWSVSAAFDDQWLFGGVLCKLSSYVIAVNRYSSIFFMTGMSVDRYMAVVKLLDSKFIRTRRCILITCTIIWIISLVMGIPSLVYRDLSTQDSEHTYCIEDQDSIIFKGISLASLFLAFVLPVIIILFCYCSISARLYSHFHHANRYDQKRKKTLKIIFTIITAFVCSWLPFNTFKTLYLLFSFQGKMPPCRVGILRQGLTITACFAFLSSCVNPIIYTFLDNHFRKRAHRLLVKALGRYTERRNSFGESWASETSSTFVSRIRANSVKELQNMNKTQQNTIPT
uniref:G protein-coupled receptor 25 n=2 Tax=Latimeria chalumnae TaxID=7897 RepID=H3AQL3_LATCH